MYSAKGLELVAKAADCAGLLSGDLHDMVSADDLLLGEMAMALLNDAKVLSC
jgi:hypothetical protein